MKKRIASVLVATMLLSCFPFSFASATEGKATSEESVFVADAYADVVFEVRVLSEEGEDLTDEVTFSQRAYITLPGIDDRPIRADLKSEEAHGEGYSSGLPFEGYRIPFDSKKVKEGTPVEPSVTLAATDVDSPFTFLSSELEDISKDEGNEFHYLVTLTVRVPDGKRQADEDAKAIAESRDELENELKEVKEKLEALNKELEVENARKNIVQSSLADRKMAAEEAEARNTEVRDQIREKYEELKDCKDKLKEMIDASNDQMAFQEISARMFALRTDLASLRENTLSFRIEAERTKNAFDHAVRELESLDKRISVKEKEKDALDAGVKELEESIADLDKEEKSIAEYTSINEEFNKARKEKNPDALKKVLARCLKAYQDSGEQEDLWDLLNRIYSEWAKFYSKEEREALFETFGALGQ